MKVFIMIYIEPFEEAWIEGVFDSRKKAEEHLKTVQYDENYYNIEEWDVK